MVTHDHGISQNGRKAQQNGPVTHLTERKKHKTRTISYHRSIMRKAHRLPGQKVDLRYPRANRSEVLLINALEVATNTQSLEMYTCVRDGSDKVVELKPMPREQPVEVSSELLPSFVAGLRAFYR